MALEIPLRLRPEFWPAGTRPSSLRAESKSLGVDGSAPVRIEGSPVYSLSLVVHNRSATALRLPAVDLALTDTQGRTAVRRVLLGREPGPSADRRPPGGELALQALLDLGGRGVAGCTIELFRP